MRKCADCFHGGAAVFAIPSVLAVLIGSICFGESPRPAGPPYFGQEIHRPHPHPEPIRFAEGVVPPGLRRIEVVWTDNDSRLLGWNPWKCCRGNPEAADLFFWLREITLLEPLWQKEGATYAQYVEFDVREF